MSKNLGNIPRQINMSEEQQQTFTNGINKGRKLERERIIKIIEAGCDCFYDEKCANHILILNINKNWE